MLEVIIEHHYQVAGFVVVVMKCHERTRESCYTDRESRGPRGWAKFKIESLFFDPTK